MTKLLQLFNRHNPQVASFVEQGGIDSSFKFSFNNFPFAFAVEGYIDK